MSKYTTTIEQPLFPISGSPLPGLPAGGWGLVALGVGVVVARQWARPKVKSAVDLATLQPLQWLGQGKALENAQQFAAAIALYDEALQYHPQDFRLWHERGLALAKLQRFEAALESYDRAHAINPHQRDLAHERGDTLLQLERFEEAIVCFERYLRYQPDSAHVLGDQAFALYRLGKYEAALAIFDRILKTEVRDRVSLHYAHFYQIQTLQQLGQLDRAWQSAQQAMQRYPNDALKVLHSELRPDCITSEDY